MKVRWRSEQRCRAGKQIGYKLILFDAEPLRVFTNIPQSVLVAAGKVMKTDFDRAYVHDGKIIIRTNPRMTPIDESFSIKAEVPFREQTEPASPIHAHSLSKSSEAFLKFCCGYPKLLIVRDTSQSDGADGWCHSCRQV